MAFPAPTMSMRLPRLGDLSDSKRRCQDQERCAALYMACGTPFSDYLGFVIIHLGVSYKTGLPRGEVRVQCCTWLLNLAPCYWLLGVVEQSVLSTDFAQCLAYFASLAKQATLVILLGHGCCAIQLDSTRDVYWTVQCEP